MLYVWKAQILTSSANLDSALAEYRKTATIFEAFTAAESTDIEAQVTLGATRTKIGDVLLMQKNFAAANQMYQQAISHVESLALATPAHHQAQYTLADAYSGMGDIALNQAKSRARDESLKQARSWYEKSWAVWKQVRNPGRISPGGFYSA